MKEIYKEELGYRVSFSFTDNFNQTTTLEKTLAECQSVDSNDLEMLLDQFKMFLKACGFSDALVDSIYIED